MLLREAIENISGFRYMIDNLDIRSGLGKSFMWELPWLEDVTDWAGELGRLERFTHLVGDPCHASFFESLSVKLSRVKDIRGTVKRLNENLVLDDLELFELKSFALSVEELCEVSERCPEMIIPRLERLVELLDPEGNRVPHFYIYDLYSVELAEVRAEMKKLKEAGGNEDKIDRLYFESVELEDEIRDTLTIEIRKYKEKIRAALEAVAYLDILLAKAKQVLKMNLCLPVICAGQSGDIVRYEGIFYPQLKALLEGEGKRFQPVDISLLPGATVLTGANMAGKSVLLKSLALAQSLAQFGFGIPARQAVIVPVSDILTCIGDGQNELDGLSSFAAEMLCIDAIIRRICNGERVLVLIDELSRTTNPIEGKAIVNAMVEFLTEQRVLSLLTTHYSGITARCRKLRVKGFREEKMKGRLTLKNITEFIDYAVLEDETDGVAQEAIRIAEILGVSEKLTEKAKKFIGK